jgi:hypothetical protein
MSGEREKLRRQVRRYVTQLRELGRDHNRTVVFEGYDLPAWLIDDPDHETLCRRWLVLADGDVWRETVYDDFDGATLARNEYTWLVTPNDSLDSLLERTLADVHAGGDGLLLDAGPDAPVYWVRDRRRIQRSHGGQERRRNAGGD